VKANRGDAVSLAKLAVDEAVRKAIQTRQESLGGNPVTGRAHRRNRKRMK